MTITRCDQFQPDVQAALICLTTDSTYQQQLTTLLGEQPTQWLNATGYDSSFNDLQPLLGKTAEALGNRPVIIAGLGQPEDLTAAKLNKLAASLIKAIQKKYARVAIDVTMVPADLQRGLILALLHANYVFDQFKSSKTQRVLEQLDFIGLDAKLDVQALQLITAISQGQDTARDLGNLPGNLCYPEMLAAEAEKLAAEFPDRLQVTILEPQQLAELNMNAFLAVSQGSDRPGRLVIMQYGQRHAEQPVVLVGKGVTFDSGGISIKPGAAMDEMKFDMCGAASVMGVMRALCESHLPVHVVGAMACVENMPSGSASRPGDVITTMSGQTVEILNTDAEGRLVLCDTLTYIERYRPELVIDIATLTGACVVALGKVVSGLFTQDDALALDLVAAGEQSLDRVWRMPLLEDYQELLDSSIADMGNIGGPAGGAITAACFLQRYCRDYRWAHLDIAGTAWISGAQKGATGRPVPLLMQFLINHQQKR